MFDEKLIPKEAIQIAGMGGQINNQGGTAILAILQKLFAEDPKRKGENS
jgi:hypothetical protein